MIRIGVVGLQGDVEEHITSFDRAFREFGIKGTSKWARRPVDMEDMDGIVIPGGESTTISKLLTKFGLRKIVLDMAEQEKPILGTCAGCVLLANEGDVLVKRTETELLGLMDMSVDRNAFGPQRESFEAPVEIDGLGTYPGVFIRAPLITAVRGRCTGIGRFNGKIVLARQGKMMAASFHPELTDDMRFHRLFLDLF
ncbi:MAG: pyridoxal 5'-phosphate synthase glutaminase subunit PdxT [Thermoplasmatota archaeon]